MVVMSANQPRISYEAGLDPVVSKTQVNNLDYSANVLHNRSTLELSI